MDTKCEVVRVVSDQSLIDSESYERRYHTSRPLTPGFYAVVWPLSVSDLRYDDEAQFIGPCRGRTHAESILQRRSMRWPAVDLHQVEPLPWK
jgi:hypothetical protein